MRRNIFSAISISSLMITFFMFGYNSPKWNGSFFNFLYNLSMPFVLGGFGIISAIFGIKGDTRMVLIVLNTFSMFLFLGAYLMGIFGFQNP